MATYIGNQPTPQSTQTRDVFTATAGQTTFATSGYTPNYVDCWLNGIKLIEGEDFTAANGSDIVLTSGAAADDVLEVVSLSTFEVARHQQTRTHQEFTATAGQTTFTVGSTYVQGAVEVFLNGLKLNEEDFTAINGTDVILAEACVAGDEVVVIWYGTFDVADAYTKAESDNRYVNVAGDTMTGGLNITSGLNVTGGNLGVGTSSPDSIQTLQDDTNTLGPLLTFKNQYRNGTTTADYMGGVAFSAWRDISPSKSYTAGIYALNEDYPGTNGNLVFTTGVNGGTDPYNAGVERMRIDSAGRVTMPYQPAFWAYSAGANSQTAGFITFTSTQANRGGHYSTATGRFTAPVSGAYHFSGMLLHRVNGISGAAEWTFTVNGANVSNRSMVYSATNTSNGHIPAASQLIVGLNAGDYVQMFIYYMTTGQDYYTGERLAHFSGYLIG